MFKKQKIKEKARFCVLEVHQVTHSYSGSILSVCTLEFQAYGHGNSYQYSKAIEDGATFRKGPVHSNKAVNQVAWHMLTRQFAICHSAWMELKAKLWTHRGDRHCSDTAQEPFSDSCNTDYIVWRPIKGENDESSHAGHTQCTNGSSQMVDDRGGAQILKAHFGRRVGNSGGSLTADTQDKRLRNLIWVCVVDNLLSNHFYAGFNCSPKTLIIIIIIITFILCVSLFVSVDVR